MIVQGIKTVIIIAVLISYTTVSAQEEYNNWLLINGSVLNFNTSPATLIPPNDEEFKNSALRYSNYTIALSDHNGEMLLYGYLEKKGNTMPEYIIKNADKRDVIRLTMGYDPSNVIGCKSPQGEYYTAVAYRKEFTKPVELHVYQFDQTGKVKNEFVQQDSSGYTFFVDFMKFKDFVVLVAYRANQMETYKLTPEGCFLWNTSEMALDSQFMERLTPYFDITHSLDNEKIIVTIHDIAYVFNFNQTTGEVSILYRLKNINFNAMTFSKTDKYFFTIDEGKLKGLRYDKNFNLDFDNPDIIYDLTKYIASNVWEMATGIDGKLYIFQYLTDYMIVLDGIETGNITQEVIETGNLVYANFPQISRKAEIDDCRASAHFDNATTCHGQPLNILLQGTPPFEIQYTIDGEPQTITTTEPEYKLPDIPGKYQLTKIKDATCEAVPTRNNTSEVAPEMKPLRIIAE